MNERRRKDINRALALVREAQDILTTARDEEQDYYDNMPDSMRDSDKGENAQAVIDVLEEADMSINGFVDDIEDCIGR